MLTAPPHRTERLREAGAALAAAHGTDNCFAGVLPTPAVRAGAAAA
ncbi:hypothetical protein [Streptomyces sp. NRRL F-5123]|nr:hypothetical protein [Streptomyces sp. NRRL F-5123]